MTSKASELQAIAELGTVEYTVTKVIKFDDPGAWYTVGDRKLLFSTTAYLKAGVNLSLFSMKNVKIDEDKKSIVVTLPHAELLSLNMPPAQNKLAYKKVGIARQDFSVEERNKLLRQSEKEIREEVPDLGILQDAEKNATDFFNALLYQMGFETVTVKFA